MTTASGVKTATLPPQTTGLSMARLARWLRRGPVHVVIIVICLIWMTPTVGLLVSSFRPAYLVATTGWWTAFKTPFQFTLDNYRQVLTTNNMGLSFVNSLIISIPATVIPILIAAFAAYAFAWMNFPGRQVLFVVVVGLLVVPLQMTLVPVLRIYTTLGLTGTFAGVWLAHAGYGLPFAIYLLAQLLRRLAARHVRVGLSGRRHAVHGLLPTGAADLGAGAGLAGDLSVHVGLE